MMTPDEIEEAQDDEEYYGSFSINKTQQRQQPRRPSLKRDTWHGLSKEDQLIWDQLSSLGKWTIIGNQDSSEKGASKGGPSSRSAHLTEMSSEQDVEQEEDDSKGDEPSLLIQAAT